MALIPHFPKYSLTSVASTSHERLLFCKTKPPATRITNNTVRAFGTNLIGYDRR